MYVMCLFKSKHHCWLHGKDRVFPTRTTQRIRSARITQGKRSPSPQCYSRSSGSLPEGYEAKRQCEHSNLKTHGTHTRGPKTSTANSVKNKHKKNPTRVRAFKNGTKWTQDNTVRLQDTSHCSPCKIESGPRPSQSWWSGRLWNLAANNYSKTIEFPVSGASRIRKSHPWTVFPACHVFLTVTHL